MIIGPIARLFFYVSMVILPIWQDFVSTSSDYTLRGLLRPILASASAAVVVILARTRNPIVDGDKPIEVASPVGKPLKVTEVALEAAKRTTLKGRKERRKKDKDPLESVELRREAPKKEKGKK